MAPEYFTLDATPLVGPNSEFCREIGYTDGREFCPVRLESDPDRRLCEAWIMGNAEDTGKPGPTWSRDWEHWCTTFEESGCQHNPDNPFSLFIQLGGKYQACKGEDDLRPGRRSTASRRMRAATRPRPARSSSTSGSRLGYAWARPYLHPEVFARVREQLGSRTPGRRRRSTSAAAPGCRPWRSSALAGDVVGTDASPARCCATRGRAERIRYVACGGGGPAVPRRRSFDLVVACGSIDWVDRRRFLPRAAELFTSGGFLVALDFGDTGRSPDVPGLARWYDEVFQKRYPRPPANDPVIGAAEAARCGFEAPSWSDFASASAFNAREYAAS